MSSIQLLVLLILIYESHSHIITTQSNVWLRETKLIEWKDVDIGGYTQVIYKAPVSVKILSLQWHFEAYFEKKTFSKEYNKTHLKTGICKDPCSAGYAMAVLDASANQLVFDFTVGQPVATPKQSVLLYRTSLASHNTPTLPQLKRFDNQIIYDHSFIILNAGDKLVFQLDHTCCHGGGPSGHGFVSFATQVYTPIHKNKS